VQAIMREIAILKELSYEKSDNQLPDIVHAT